MTHAMPDTTTYEQVVESFEQFYAECSCGWCGDVHHSHGPAEQDALDHEAEAHAIALNQEEH